MASKSLALAGVGLGLAAGIMFGSLIRKPGTSVAQGVEQCFLGSDSQNGTSFVKVDGSDVSVASLPIELQQELFEVEAQAYLRRLEIAQETLVRFSIAKELDPKVDAKALPPWAELLGDDRVKDEDVKRFVEANKASIPPDVTFEKIEPSIRKHLEGQKIRELIRSRSEELKQRGGNETSLPPPCSPRLSADVGRFPTKAEGKHQIVYVSHAFCSRCRAMNQDVESAVALMKDKVKMVHVLLPTRTDDLGGLVARGGYCAQKQGSDKYWKYAELGYQIPFHFETQKTGSEATATVLDLAEKSFLDKAEFESCLESEESRQWVEKTKEDFTKAGVPNAPALYLNGRKILLGEQASLLPFLKNVLGE